MRIVFCDDEEINLKINKIYVDDFLKKKGIEKYKIAAFTEYNEKFNRLVENKLIDIAILDIDIKNNTVNGIEMAKKIHEANGDAIIIFISSHPEYAYDAFGVSALGFIKKPYTLKDFCIQFENVFTQFQSGMKLRNVKKVLNIGSSYIDASEIYYLEKQKNKLLIHMKADTISENISLCKVAPELPEYFLKLERGLYINKYYITKVSEGRIYLTDGVSFHIPERQKKRVMEDYDVFLHKIGR